jgi:hypothetical protein
MEGVVYKEFMDQRRPRAPDRPVPDPPADWPRWRLIDYGASAPTACLWVALAPNEHAYVYREYYQGT